MLKDAISYLLDLGVKYDPTFNLGGIEYSKSTLKPVEPPGYPTLRVRTLRGLIDAIDSLLDVSQPIIHIASYQEVRLIERPTTPMFKEYVYAVAKANYRQSHQIIGADPEMFIIDLLANFVPTDARDEVLRVVSNLQAEAVQTAVDDGVSQVVSTKQGVKAAKVKISNPVYLAPYSTFPEIDQPERPFVLRFGGGGSRGNISVSLYESASTEWQQGVIRDIAEYIERNNQSIPIIA